MGQFAVGDIVMLAFPYSDLTAVKKRPALIIGLAEFGNYITCQITSKSHSSLSAVALQDCDFAVGGLPVSSYARPDKLFTVDPSIIQSKLGSLVGAKISDIQAAVRIIIC